MVKESLYTTCGKKLLLLNLSIVFSFISQMLHVWYIYLHLPYMYGKCRINIPVPLKISFHPNTFGPRILLKSTTTFENMSYGLLDFAITYIYHGPSKPTFLEVFMVNNLIFKWPKPLFFMVLGAHGIYIYIYHPRYILDMSASHTIPILQGIVMGVV